MALTALQMEARANRLTASFLPALMAGDEQKILNEWRRIVDDPAYEPEDLSDKWPVQFGSFIEPFALDWHQRRTGQALIRRGENVTHPDRPHVCCTLDAWRPSDRAVVDCKAIGQWRKLDDVIPYYVPQLVVQSGCLGAEKASLLIVHGGGEPVEHPVEWTPEYEAAVWQRADEFWRCVETLTPPVAMTPVAPPVPPEQWRTVDLLERDGPNWADDMRSHLTLWYATAAYAKNNAKATKAVKDLLPDDVGLVTWDGVKVSRAKNGAVTIRESDR